MATSILGWVLIIAGILFVLAGVVGAARTLFSGKTAAGPGVRGLIGDVTKLVDAILRAPTWLIMTALGVALIWMGQRALSGLPVLPF